MKPLHAWAALFLIAAACQTSEPEPLTEVLVQIYADALVQQAGDTLVVEILSGEKTASELSASDPERFDLTSEDFHWPVTITLVAKRSHEGHIFELNLRLEKAGDVLAHGRVQSGFVKGQTLVLQTSLGAECLGKLDCPANETCVVNNGRASCESAAIDPGALPDVGNAPKSNDAGTAPIDAGKLGDAGETARDAAVGGDGATPDAGVPVPGDCVASPEDCTNGMDDDCNGAVDCADSACEPITECVPTALAFAMVGEAEDCPAGYEFFDLVYEQLTDPGCSGCSCEPVPKECSVSVSVYETALSCARDSQPFSAGQALQDPVTDECSRPIGKQLDLASSVYGFRVNVKTSADACTPSGEAKPLPPTWGGTHKRCRAQLRRNGCRFGTFCAPQQDVAHLCWPQESAGCRDTESAYSFYQGYDDRRSCQACGCTANGGTCKGVGATLTSETTCGLGTGTVLTDGQKSCETIPLDASTRMVGKPRSPSCTSGAAVEGSLLPKLQFNLCCSP